MNIKFNRKLKKLRQKNNVTQEQLASYLKISSQAVSKWERNEGYPEISLLPRLAFYFGVTVDELLGIDEERIRAQVAEWITESNHLIKLGEKQKNFELWEAAYNEYPRDPEVMFYYMHAVWYISTPKNDMEGIELGMSIGADILECCTDNLIRNYTIRSLAYNHKRIGNIEEAKKYASMTSDLITCSEVLLSDVLDGEEKLKHTQELMILLTEELASKAITLSDSFYELDEQIAICHYIIQLYEMLFTDRDYGFYAMRIGRYMFRLAEHYAEKKDRDNCIKYLRDSADKAILFDKGIGEGVQRTSLLLNKTVGAVHAFDDFEFHECRRRRNELDNKCFDFISNDSELIQIKEDLEAIINKYDTTDRWVEERSDT